MRDYTNLENFLNERVFDAHPDYVYGDETNTRIALISAHKLKDYGMRQGDKIVDVGCGKGRDMQVFDVLGYKVHGINFLQSEADKDPRITVCDQSFTPFDNGYFDCVWSRHCLEHSIMPYFTLVEYNRILKEGGLCYIELPAPNTGAYHETNPNHYSVMDQQMWECLFKRAGFEIVCKNNADFEGERKDNGEVELLDRYFIYFLKKLGKPVAGYFREEDKRGVTMSKVEWNKMVGDNV